MRILARHATLSALALQVPATDNSCTDALKILSDDPTTSHIPIIALSANAMPRDVERGLKAGFFRYLTKPMRVPELLETLGAALELAEARRASRD